MRSVLFLATFAGMVAVVHAQPKAPAPPAAKPKPVAAAAARPATAPRPAAAKPPAPAKKAVTPAKPKPPIGAASLQTDNDKTIYALGLSIARSLKPFDLSPAEVEIVKQALSDAAADKPDVQIDEWGPKIQPLA